MRIVAGGFRGRRIEAPPGQGTRPTTDRVREALFSSIGAQLDVGFAGARVLDAFAGSGALGLEALSRGAQSATLIESDRRALATLRGNIETLGVQRTTRVVSGDAFALARAGRLVGGPFSLILLDPPYRIEPSEVRAFLESLVAGSAVADGALVTLEHAAGVEVDWPEGFDQVTAKRYGTTEIDIARWERGE